MTSSRAEVQRCGFAAIVGLSNVGKSTLVNQLTGSKVAIVTHKVQTTRARIRAIIIEGESQIVLVDTPGIFEPKRKLDEAMVRAAWEGAGDADVVVLLADARDGLDDPTRQLIESLGNTGLKTTLVLNKIDLVKREKLLATVAEFNAAATFADTFLISALTGDGLHELRTHLANAMPDGSWLYPADQMADLPVKLLAAEITREKLFLRMHDELPYQLTVETESWKERPDGSVRVEQVVYVTRDSHKKMVIGKGGQNIKIIGQQAREEIAEVMGQTVHLFLFVKVREKWADDPERLKMMGL